MKKNGLLYCMKHLNTRMAGLRSSAIAVLWKTRALQLLTMLLLARISAPAQAPAWQLALGLNGDSTSTSLVTGTATDNQGNVYLAGHFMGNVVIGPYGFRSAGSNDIFVACWNAAAGGFTWARQVGNTGDDQVWAIAVADTSVYLAGSFLSPSLRFGTTQLLAVPAPGAPGSPAQPSMDGYVARLSMTGTFGWAHLLGDSYISQPYHLAVSGSSVYVAGSWQGSDIVVDGVAHAASGSGDQFVAKFRDAGGSAAFAWAQRLDVPVTALAATARGAYVAGYFYASNQVLGDTMLHNSFPGSTGWYITRLQDAGSGVRFGWSRTTDSPGSEIIRALVADGNALYLAGSFSGSTTQFGAFTLTNTNNRDDIFVAKFADTGPGSQVVWAQQAGGTFHERVGALAVRGSQLYLSGSFASPTATFGAHSVSGSAPPTTSPGNDTDIYVAKLVDAGSSASWAWAQAAGSPTGNNVDVGRGIAVLGPQVYVTGSASGGGSFGSHQLPTSLGIFGAFVGILDETILGMTSGAGTAAALQCVPNPATGHTTLYGGGVAPGLLTHLTVLDPLGRAVRSALVPTAQLTTGCPLDLAGLAPGLYLVRLTGSGGTQLTRRLVVE